METGSALGLKLKTSDRFKRRTSAVGPNWSGVGLAGTGGKQAILKRADHRFVERIDFITH